MPSASAAELGHDVCFNELIVSGASGEDEARGDASARTSRMPSRTRVRSSGEGVPSGLAGIAEDDDGVEVGGGGVAGGEGDVADTVDDEGEGEGQEGEDEEGSA